MTTTTDSVTAPPATPAPPKRADRLRDIQARRAAVPPAPWRWSGNTDYDDPRLVSADSFRDVLGLVSRPVSRAEARRLGYGHPDTIAVTDVRDPNTDLHVATLVEKERVERYPEDTYQQRLDEAMERAADRAIDQYLNDDTDRPRTEQRLAFVTDGAYHAACDMAIYDAAPEATRRADRRVYRADICGIRHPVAEFLAHSAADVDWLIAEVKMLREQIAGNVGAPYPRTPPAGH